MFKKTGKNFMERFYKMVNMRFSVYLINILKILFLKYFNIIVHNGLYFLFTLLQENITVCGKQGGKLEVNATKSSWSVWTAWSWSWARSHRRFTWRGCLSLEPSEPSTKLFIPVLALIALKVGSNTLLSSQTPTQPWNLTMLDPSAFGVVKK